jgi:hypothetical protein
MKERNNLSIDEVVGYLRCEDGSIELLKIEVTKCVNKLSTSSF